MTASLVVPLVRHSAPDSWGPSARAEVASRLAAVGLDLTLCSDARERMGFPRLSDASDWDRAHCHLHAGSPEFRAVVAELRAERAYLQEALAAPSRRAVVAEARRLLGLRSGWQLRIGELAALVDQVRVLELGAPGELRSTWRAVTAPLYRRIPTEAELFGGVVS